MEGLNSFEKGLHRSNSPAEQPEGSYVDAYNWIRNDSGRLVNEELEEVIKKLTDAKGYEFLGSCPVNNSFVCFFKQNANNGNFYSEIGIFENGTYTRVFNDFFTNPSYSLNFTNSIDSVARIVSTGDTIVYFVEEDNKPRRFNLTAFQNEVNPYTSELYNTVEDWNLQLTFKMPYATYSVQRNGTLPTGTYSFAFRYATDENNKTTFNIPSRFFNIANSSQDNNDTVTGDLPQTSSNQNIVMSLQNLDTNYPYVEVVVITYLGITNVLSIKSLGLFENKNNLQINFNSASQYLQDVSESALLEMPINVNSATCVEQKDNILILSNITSKKFDSGFQKDVANNIKLYWTTEQVPVDNRRNITGVRQGGSLCWPVGNYAIGGIDSTRRYGDMYGTQDRPSESRDQNFQQSNVYQDPQILKGFQRGEVYSFSITPIYKDGSVGFAYHIPGNTTPNVNQPTLKVWESDYTYTQMYEDTGLIGKIRHHQMPDYNECGYVGDADYVYILKVQVANINFTPEQLNNIQGYIIGYQPRNSDVNTRIIDNGFSRPYLKNEYSDKYIGTLWTGSVIHVEKLGSNNTDESTSSYTWSTNWSNNQEYAMYHSPDSLLDKQKIKAGYKVERVGYGNNLILHSGNSALDSTYFEQYINKGDPPYYVKMTLPICTNNASGANNSYLYTNMFFEFNEFVSNKGNPINIDSAEYVPFIGDENPITIDNKISITYSSEYIHLKTNGSHFFDNTSFSDKKYFLDPQYFISQLEGHGNQNGASIHNPSLNRVNDNTQRIGINLCRIVNENPQQYGILENAEYTPAIVVLGNIVTNTIIEGDVYISKYFFNIFDKLNGRTSNETIEGHSMMGMYVESKNNYALRHTEDGKVPFYPNYKYFVTPSTNTTTPGMFNLDWYKVSTGYNKQYSSLTGVKLNFPKPLFFNEIVNYNNRSIYSNQSFESELVDQYRIFSANSFHDIPRHRGVIKDTFVFNNNFYHHTEYGLWLSYFNPNTIQSTTQGDVVLGNAGIFRIPSKLILDIKGGYMGTNDKSGTNTPFGRVFLDHYQGKVFLFAGEAPTEISDLGLFSFFRDFVNTTDEYTMGYDWANKRLLINNITQEKAISYYPKTETWTSLHDFSPNGYLTLNGESYAWKDSTNSFYNLKNANGIRKEAYVTLVTNTQPDAFKRFDRIEMNTMSGGKGGLYFPGSVPNPDNYVFINKSFTTIHCWTDRQNSTELPFLYSHDYNIMSQYYEDQIPANYYRSSFHAELPLDAVLDPYQDIFDEANNVSTSTEFKAHFKGKFLYTKLSYKESNPLVLNYVKTFFKPSVA
jgi:hypothetical protein